MLDVMMLIALVGSVVGPLMVARWKERKDDEALAVSAEVVYAMNRALGGESVIAVHALAARPWRRGRVLLSVSPGYEWLLDEVMGSVLRHVPSEFEVVVPGGEGAARRPLATWVASGAVLRKAA
jgi:hypothetical protein